MTATEIREMCDEWQAGLTRRDLRALADLYAEHAVVESPMSGTVSGRHAAITAFEGLFGAFPDMSWTFEPPIADGNRVALIAEVTGSHSGTFMGLPPTGRPYHFRIVFLLDVEDQRIVRDRRVYDFTGFLVQVGALKAKPA